MKPCRKKLHQYEPTGKGCPECNKVTNAKWYQVNKDRVKTASTTHRQANPEKYKAYIAEWQKNNPDKRKANIVKWKQANPDKVKAARAKYMKNRKAKDPLFKLKCNLSNLIGMSLKRQGYSKSTKSAELLGAPYELVQAHLKYTAIRNYGSYDPTKKYEIDHIVPVATATTQEEAEKLQFYQNLQLLTPEDNLKKLAKLDWKLGV